MTKILAKVLNRSFNKGEYTEMDLFDTDRHPLVLGGASAWKLLDLTQGFDFSTPWTLSSTVESQLTGLLWNITVDTPSFGIFWMAAKGHVNSSNGFAGFGLKAVLSEVNGQMREYYIIGTSRVAASGVSGDLAIDVDPSHAPPNLPYQPVILVPGQTYSVQLFGQKNTADVTKLLDVRMGLVVCPDAKMIEAPMPT